MEIVMAEPVTRAGWICRRRSEAGKEPGEPFEKIEQLELGRKLVAIWLQLDGIDPGLNRGQKAAQGRPGREFACDLRCLASVLRLLFYE